MLWDKCAPVENPDACFPGSWPWWFQLELPLLSRMVLEGWWWPFLLLWIILLSPGPILALWPQLPASPFLS